MKLKKISFRIPQPSIVLGLILLTLIQLPLALNQALKLTCVATTWADYASFWQWQDIPLDARVRFCNGGYNSSTILKQKVALPKQIDRQL